MTYKSIDYFIRNELEQKYAALADQLAAMFAEHAALHDENNTFPFANFDAIKRSGYLKVMVPQEYGGDEASLYEMIMMQERLARGDGSTALAVGWHTGIMLSLRMNRIWPEHIYAEMCKRVVQDGEMLNNFASEPASGSPSRGGKPQTIARRVADGWLISGRKNFSTLSPILNYFVVSASMEGEDRVGRFLVQKSERVRIEETWNALGMRATGSHDLILEDVFVPADHLVEDDGDGQAHHDQDQAWLLHIPACYIGIAHAARDFAIDYAHKYQPASLPHPIAELPNVRRLIGEIEAELHTARTLLYATADRWDHDVARRPYMKRECGLAKKVAVNSALSIVDKAMRIVGGASLSKSLPLERMYRDVRAGLHNPPMDDAVIATLADAALRE